MNITHTQLHINAAKELADRAQPEFMRMLESSMEDLTYINLNRCAGMLDMNTGAVKRMLQEVIVDFGARNKRVALSDLRKAIDARKAKIERGRKRADDANQLGLSL